MCILCLNIHFGITRAEPASVAQSDANPTGDQEVAGSIPGPSNNLSIDHEIFSTVIFSLPLIPELINRIVD